MTETEIQRIAKTWISLYYLPEDSDERENNFWAYDQMCDLCQEAPESAWHVIEAIRKLDSDEVILSNLAAGPLEDLLVAHGEQFIGRIETLAKNDKQLQKLLGAVLKNDIQEAVWKRVKAIAGPSW